MGRRQRNQSEPLCYHLTHRCHGRDFLLKFRKDRRNYLMRLHEMSRRYPVDVLTYMITANHVHLLFWAERAGAVSDAMHFLQGTVAGDYNRRKDREGAFWRGRYHPTLVETGTHLSRCLFYIDLNMVRAKACRHPAEWIGGAYAEILGERQRYRIINRQRLRWCLGMSGQPDTVFASWYRTTIDEEAGRRYWVREPFWSEALAVGSEEWVGSLLPGVRNARMECVVPADRATEVEESPGTYAAYAPKRSKEAFWQEKMR
jgi:putative transposase